ncbi:hypothetical protein E8E14_014107 [Neopestalotiopsis sp. 37M]|nr:hypothetical protein E8E14_014107 [Neopestalotiopsis sp. 37M]
MSEKTDDSSPAANTTRPRKSHRKSRNGCRNCKRRKVKCDEVKPECTNCLRFGLPCDFKGSAIHNSSQGHNAMSSQQTKSQDAAIPSRRRGRGRPRRDWLQEFQATNSLPAAPKTEKKEAIHDPYTLNTANIELMLHFTAFTAGSLSGTMSRKDKITNFWAFNVPKIGISHHFVLNLVFAVSAYHLAHTEASDNAQRLDYTQQAEYHFEHGLAAFTQALAGANESNCGALDVSATMVCYCTFAAGPKGPNDLLICRVEDQIAHNWWPVIKGLRLIREIFDADVLFSGLMAPLGPSDSPQIPDSRAQCLRENFPRIDWEDQIKSLGDMIKSSSSIHRDTYLTEYDILAAIYEGTYGDENGQYLGLGHNRMVFAWMYRLDDAFVDRVREKDPIPLVLLAYFAQLLTTLKKCWFMDGWAEHLLENTSRMLDEEHRKWVEWPRIQCGLPP